MKQYKIVVNGTSYEVAIEEIDASAASEKKAAPASVAAPVTPKTVGGEIVTAPIPGTVLELKAAEGAVVAAGQVVCVLESMKMENEIVAPVAGKVSYAVAKGATVAAGDTLCTIA